MAKVKYDDIRLEVADNGFILGYVEIKARQGKTSTNQWDNPARDWKKEVFQWTQGADALKRMATLAAAAHPGAAGALKEASVKS